MSSRCHVCDGTGNMTVTEDGPVYQQPCWHCDGSGTLTEQQAARLRLQEVVECIAIGAATDHLKDRDVSLMAAENGCYPSDIYDGLVAHLAQRFHNQLARLADEEPLLYKQVVEGLALLTKTT